MNFTSLPQGCKKLSTQLTSRHREERRVNGFLTGTQQGVILGHAWKYARNLFQRVSLPKQFLNVRLQKAVYGQASRHATCESIHRGTLMGKSRTVTTIQSRPASVSGLRLEVAPLVTRQLSIHGAGARIKVSSYCKNAAASLKAQFNQSPFLAVKMFVFGIPQHSNSGLVLHFRFELDILNKI